MKEGYCDIDYDLVVKEEPYQSYHYDYGNHKHYRRYVKLVAVKDKDTQEIILYLQPAPRNVDYEAIRARDNETHREMRRRERLITPVVINVNYKETKKE